MLLHTNNNAGKKCFFLNVSTNYLIHNKQTFESVSPHHSSNYVIHSFIHIFCWIKHSTHYEYMCAIHWR